jgi:uncharacterized membrane protein YdbT with pleckstrin-like domain
MTGLVVRPSTKTLKVAYLLCLLTAGAIFGYGRYLEKRLELLLIVPALGLLWAAGRHLSLRFTTLSIEGGRLRFEQGVLSRSTRTMDLSKIQDVRVDQSVGQRILNLGNLTLETAGEAGTLTMANIDQPRRIAEAILGAAHPAQPPAPPLKTN